MPVWLERKTARGATGQRKRPLSGKSVVALTTLASLGGRLSNARPALRSLFDAL